MFALGAAGFTHELVISQVERPFMLALCGALMGLPFVLKADDWKVRKEDDEEEGDRWSHLP
jgi:hypothetical protein